MDFADAGSAGVQASGRLADGGIAPCRVHGRKGDYPVRMGRGGLDQVVVDLRGNPRIGPAKSHNHRSVNARSVHVLEQLVRIGHPAAGPGKQRGIGGVAASQLVVAGVEIWRQNVAVAVDDHQRGSAVPIVTICQTSIAHRLSRTRAAIKPNQR